MREGNNQEKLRRVCFAAFRKVETVIILDYGQTRLLGLLLLKLLRDTP
jgi:hypothetical protein